MTATDFANLIRQFDRELWIITAASENQRGGLLATSLLSVSIVPDLPRIILGISKLHATWHLIHHSRTFSAHLLSSTDNYIATRFGLHSSRDIDKFAGLTCDTDSLGNPRLTATWASFSCQVEAAWDIGDRTLFLAAVVDGRTSETGQPLTLHPWLNSCSESEKARLRQLLELDSQQDAAAIHQWRAQHQLALQNSHTPID